MILFGEKKTVFRSLLRTHCQASDLHCLTFNWWPQQNMLYSYCESVPELLLLDFFDFFGNPLKWLAEEMIQFSKAPNYIRHVLLELSTNCRWKETCDIECWGLRQPLSEYSFFLTISGLENAWWKQTFFRAPVRVHSQASELNCITFNWRPRHDKLQTYCISVPELLLWDLFDFIEKPFEMASRRNDSVNEGSKSHHTCFAWTYYHLSMERDLWHWMLRPQTHHLVSLHFF